MRCERCQGAGYEIIGRACNGKYGIGRVVCSDCNGGGIAHCCDGLRERPSILTDVSYGNPHSE